MHSSIIAHIVLLLSILGFAIASPEAETPAAKLEARQQPPVRSMAELCAEYEWTANMSTIGANGTYRTVLLQKSNVGTIYNARMMNDAIKKLPAMTADTMLNSACPNWTAIALAEAERNYTQGIVAQFTTEGLPVGIKAGPEVVLVVGAVSIIFSLVWIFSG